MNDNGYKVCYREEGRKTFVRYMCCNTYSGAEWTIQRCRCDPPRTKDGHILKKPAWKIIPLTYKELLAIRKVVPFDFP